MIVVSDIGEQWSPQTAPAIQADTQMIARVAFEGSGSVREKALNVIGIRIPNVPQDVPVAKDKAHAIRKITAGMIPMNEPFVNTVQSGYKILYLFFGSVLCSAMRTFLLSHGVTS